MTRHEGDELPGRGDVTDDVAVLRLYGQRGYNALNELVRLCDLGARFVARGRAWYDADPDNVPGLAAEALIVKIGENVSRVPETCRTDHPDIPWTLIKDMRNRLTHYDEATDYGVVWDTVENNLPQIRDQVGRILGRRA